MTVRRAPAVIRLLARPSGGAALLLHLAGGVVCAALPLTRAPGYETALALALITALAAPLALLPASRLLLRVRSTAEPRPLRRVVARDFPLLFSAALLLQLGAFAVVAAAAAVAAPCVAADALLFLLLIPTPAAAFAAGLSLLLTALFRRGAGWAHAAVTAVLLVLPVLQILTQPQVFAYNHLFGMFVGLSWDEARPPLSTLALYRVTTLAYVMLMCAAAALLRTRGGLHGVAPTARRALAAWTLPALLVAAAGVLWSDALGFSASAAHTRAALGAVRRTAHFDIVHDPRVVDTLLLRRVAGEHEFRLAEVCRALDVRYGRRITSYLYPDRAAKRRLLGTESSQLARPWAAEVHLSMESWQASLEHELVHVVAGAFGPHLNRAPFLRDLGLTEGLAMAVEWEADERTLHEQAAGLLALGMLPHARAVMGTCGFLTHPSTMGYTAAGSFTRWLIDTRGMRVVRRGYERDDLQSAAGATYEQLDEAWRAYLRAVPRLLPDSVALRARFAGQSVFRKACPRAITEANRAADALLAAGYWRAAAQAFRASDRIAPNPRAAFGLVQALAAGGEARAVRAAASRLLADPARREGLVLLRLWRGDAAALLGDTAAARSDWRVLARERVSSRATSLALRRLTADSARAGGGALLRVLVEALWSAAPADSTAARSLRSLRALHARDPRDWWVRRELARVCALRPDGEAEALRLLDGPRVSEPPALAAWTGLLRGALLTGAGRTGEALREFGNVERTAPTQALRLRAQDEAARCRWLRAAR